MLNLSNELIFTCANDDSGFEEYWRTRDRGRIVGLDGRSAVNQLPARNQTLFPGVCSPETAQVYGRGSPLRETVS